MISKKNYPTYTELSLDLGWEFTEVLPGKIERDRREVDGISFPIIGPLPILGYHTKALENALAKPPYLYVIYSAIGDIKYIGKGTDERLKTVLQRWIRPDKNSGIHHWAHGTNKKKEKATITFIAEELNRGLKPVRLYFTNYERLYALVENKYKSLGYDVDHLIKLPPDIFIENVEQFMIHRLQPEWNIKGKKKSPACSIAVFGDFWQK